MYFHRALKLNPQYLSAWTLLGHEFMELKNINGAIHSYRQAIGKFFVINFNMKLNVLLNKNVLFMFLIIRSESS